MTTRKPFFALGLGAAFAALAGCATPGALHVYTLSTPHAETISDTAVEGMIEAGKNVPSFLGRGEEVIGFAYDPFTDHFFLRLAPGDRIRVVDRPARAIKREFAIAELGNVGTAQSRGDLAVRPRDGHLFASHPRESALIELTRLGKYLRTIPLAGFSAPPGSVALDLERNRFLTLRHDDRTARLYIHDAKGALSIQLPLEGVAPGSLGYDSTRREIYAPLMTGDAVGIFDESGKRLRTLPLPATFLDVGPRSFIRVF